MLSIINGKTTVIINNLSGQVNLRSQEFMNRLGIIRSDNPFRIQDKVKGAIQIILHDRYQPGDLINVHTLFAENIIP